MTSFTISNRSKVVDQLIKDIIGDRGTVTDLVIEFDAASIPVATITFLPKGDSLQQLQAFTCHLEEKKTLTSFEEAVEERFDKLIKRTEREFKKLERRIDLRACSLQMMAEHKCSQSHADP